MRIPQHLKFGNTFHRFCLQFIRNSLSRLSCYVIIAVFNRIVCCWWQTPFHAFVCVIIRTSCKHHLPNAVVISNAMIVIMPMLFYNNLSYGISHMECTTYTKILSQDILLIYYVVSLCFMLRQGNIIIIIIQLKLSCLQDRTATSSSRGRGVRA